MKITLILFLITVSWIYAIEDDRCSNPQFIGHSKKTILSSTERSGFRFQRSPGDSIGFTWKDLHEHNQGKRIMVDDSGRAHIAWMFMDSSWANRQVVWTIRDPDGSYHTPVIATEGYSGFVQIDVMPSDQRTVIAYFSRDPGNNLYYFGYTDIDSGYHCGSFPNQPAMVADTNVVNPYVAVALNGNIIVGVDGLYPTNDPNNRVYVSTDQGLTWTQKFSVDTCMHPSHIVTASPFSNKVAFIHSRFMQNDYWGPYYNYDIWYSISTDGGETWGPHTDLTNYPFARSAYAGIDAAFDLNDILHIVWEVVDTTWEGSKIYHWDQYNDTFTVVNSPSRYYYSPDSSWLYGPYSPNCYGLPADRPQIVIDRADKRYIYCLWHGNDDFNDVSYEGCFNGELYGSYSSDMGVTWSLYKNLTNTRSPGAGSGYCLSEDHMTASPYTYHDSIFVNYMVDRDAGHWSCWGERTSNPIYCWVFNKSTITAGVNGSPIRRISSGYSGPTVIRGPLRIPPDLKYRIFDISGRRSDVRSMSPGVYFLELDGSSPQKIVKIR